MERAGNAESGSGHLKPEMPVSSLVEIWNRPKFKRSSLQTHRRAVGMKLVSEALALGEITKERMMDSEEETTKPEKKFADSSLPRRIMGKSCYAIFSLTSGDRGGRGRVTLTELTSTCPAAWHRGLRLESTGEMTRTLASRCWPARHHSSECPPWPGKPSSPASSHGVFRNTPGRWPVRTASCDGAPASPPVLGAGRAGELLPTWSRESHT